MGARSAMGKKETAETRMIKIKNKCSYPWTMEGQLGAETQGRSGGQVRSDAPVGPAQLQLLPQL
jgi:hypothetical protein